jgi:hypothetical protein
LPIAHPTHDDKSLKPGRQKYDLAQSRPKPPSRYKNKAEMLAINRYDGRVNIKKAVTY